MSSAFDSLAPRAFWKTRTSADRAAGAPAISAWARLLLFAQAAVVVPIWLLSRCYGGIVHDSRIYVGRALADLDPSGLGRDMLFTMDGQTRLTLYSRLIRPLVQAAGPSATSMGMALVALLAWLAAAAWLASRLAPRGLVAAALVCAAMLPAYYGPFDIFSIGEALATPRGLAEAGVMAGLAALLGGRTWLCGALLTAALLLHPSIAAVGVGVAFLMLALQDRRWWALAPLGLVAVLIADALHIGPARLLFTAMDRDWLAVMHRRNGFLFLLDWPADAWGDAILSVSTVLVAAIAAQGRVRTLLLTTASVAALGVLASLVFGDLLSSVLVLQLQLWRVLWLAKAMAVLTAPLAARWLWRSGRCDARLALVLLALDWCMLKGAIMGAPLCAIALYLGWAAYRGGRDRIPPRVLVLVAACAGALTLLTVGEEVFYLCGLVRSTTAAGAPLPLHYCLALGVQTVPILLITVIPAVAERRLPVRFQVMALAAAAALLAPLTIGSWDQRTPTRRVIDLGQGRQALNRMIGAPGAGVVWLSDDVAPWFLLQRATWVNDLQGSLGAFSRPLALAWDQRAAALVGSGLGVMNNRNPWGRYPSRPTLTAAQFHAGTMTLCSERDAPQAIIAAGDVSAGFSPLAASVWRAPLRDVTVTRRSSHFAFRSFDQYTVIRCQEALRTAAEPSRGR